MSARAVILVRSIDEGSPTSDDFRIDTVPAPADCGDNEVLLEVTHISADPYMRGRMKPSTGGSYVGNFVPGQPISGFVVGKIIASKNAAFAVGDVVAGNTPYVTKQVVGGQLLSMMYKLPFADKPSYGIGILGMPGMTAYFGLLNVLTPKAGETLYVNAAAGAVGSLVGQIAKLKGCTVIGSAGGADKCQKVLSYGFDACIDYKQCKTAEELRAKLAEKAPKGIDMYFENVGGIQFDAVFPLLNNMGRVAVCGCIDSYNAGEVALNPIALRSFIVKQLKIEGLLVFRWMGNPTLRQQALDELAGWITASKVVAEETVLEGIDKFGEAMAGLFTGANTGKMVVKV